MNSITFKKLANQKVLLLLFVLLLAVMSVIAQTDNIESLLKEAKAADQANNFKESIADFEKVIELDPHNYAAHSGLLNTKQRQLIRSLPTDRAATEQEMEAFRSKMKADETENKAKYEQLEQKYPEKAVYKLVLSRLNIYDPVKSLSYLEAAVRVEPNSLDALQSLGLFELSRGDSRKANENFAKIVQQKPDDPEAGFYYVYSLAEVDKKLYKQKTMEYVNRFPTDKMAAQALSLLISNTEDASERIVYYDELRRIFPPDKSDISNSLLTGLFAIYSETAPDKALALAQEMINISPSENQKKSWQGYLDYQSGINQAAALIKDKKGAEALTQIDKVKIPRYFSNPSPYYLIKSEAQDATGQTSIAYTELTKYFVGKPRKAVRIQLEKLGKKLGKDKKQVGKDIQALVESQVKPIKDFSLVRFDTGKKVSLADYRGKVVLLNFWYPLCGPCHAEAPYLQKMTEKYGKDGFVILAISVHPKEDTLVMPFFQKTKYNFIPLQVPDEDFAEREYQAKGFPTNYLIDKQGRQVFNIGVVYQDVWEEVQQKIEMALEQ